MLDCLLARLPGAPADPSTPAHPDHQQSDGQRDGREDAVILALDLEDAAASGDVN